MKKIDIINAVNALGKVRINKIKDERVKFSLVQAYRKLRKASKDIDDERKEVIEKFQKDFEEDLPEVQQFRMEGKPVTGHNEFLKAEADCNRILAKMSQEEAAIDGVQPVKVDDFLRYVKEDELTLEDIDLLDGIVLE